MTISPRELRILIAARDNGSAIERTRKRATHPFRGRSLGDLIERGYITGPPTYRLLPAGRRALWIELEFRPETPQEFARLASMVKQKIDPHPIRTNWGRDEACPS